MRKFVILAALGPVLALAGCAENTGWNPNYSAVQNGTGYAKYSREREAALRGSAPIPRTIPVQLPAQAPTPADISGGAATTATRTGAVAVTTAAPAARPKTAAAAGNPPVTTSGPYPGSTPVLVRYAHQEQQNPGTTVYRRTGGSVIAAGRLCSGYASADTAQRAFIAAGGPILDPKGMDPDGDGFVCGWDPRPVRNAPGL